MITSWNVILVGQLEGVPKCLYVQNQEMEKAQAMETRKHKAENKEGGESSRGQKKVPQ